LFKKSKKFALTLKISSSIKSFKNIFISYIYFWNFLSKFSSEAGDTGTLALQGRLAYEPDASDPDRLLMLEPSVKGSFAWMTPRTLLFQPEFPGLLRGATYTIRVPGGPATGLSEDVRRKFTVAGQLEVQQVIPGDLDTEVPTGAQVIVQFSRSVAPLTTLSAQRTDPVIRFDPPLSDLDPDRPETAASVAGQVRAAIEALRDPHEPSLDLTHYRSARPELALWRCPCCRGEECLRFLDRRFLVCIACGARWDGRGGDLTLVSGGPDTGLRDTLAGWAGRAGTKAVREHGPGPLLTADAELREDPDARLTLTPLHVIGRGTASLFRSHLEWASPGAQRVLKLDEIRTVTTERADTLQLGVGGGVTQLVFPKHSPWHWQRAVEELQEASGVR